MGQQLGPDQARAGVDQQEQRKAEGEDEKEVVVVLGDRIVDDDLHIERARQNVELQHYRKGEGLNQDRRETRDLAEKIEER